MHKKETKLCLKCKTNNYFLYKNQKHSGLCASCSKRLPDFFGLYNNLCANAKKKNFSVTFTFDEFLLFTNTKKCYYCENKIEWTKYRKSQGSQRYNLDRKDNSKGYTLDNCVVCCKRCNYVKKTLGHDEFIEMCKRIAKKHNNEKVYEQSPDVFEEANKSNNNFDFTKSYVSNEAKFIKDTFFFQ
jgi:hypothetical protein